jgi:hypothetical protein
VNQVPARLNDEVFAVYTGFAHEGVDNAGDYTLVIGCRVPDASPTPAGLDTVTVPASHHVVFSVESDRTDLVAQAWQEIWALDRSARAAMTPADHTKQLIAVSEYIYDHLDEELELYRLAEIAHLSPYHWHRIYRAMCGEAAVTTVRRFGRSPRPADSPVRSSSTGYTGRPTEHRRRGA